jgi:hypothetical protein
VGSPAGSPAGSPSGSGSFSVTPTPPSYCGEATCRRHQCTSRRARLLAARAPDLGQAAQAHRGDTDQLAELRSCRPADDLVSAYGAAEIIAPAFSGASSTCNWRLADWNVTDYPLCSGAGWPYTTCDPSSFTRIDGIEYRLLTSLAVRSA